MNYYNPMMMARQTGQDISRIGNRLGEGIVGFFQNNQLWQKQKAEAKDNTTHQQLLFNNAASLAQDYGIDPSILPKPSETIASEEYATRLGQILQPEIEKVQAAQKSKAIHGQYGGGMQQPGAGGTQQQTGYPMPNVQTTAAPQQQFGNPLMQGLMDEATGAVMPTATATATAPATPTSPMAPKTFDVDDDYSEFLENQRELDKRTLALMDAGVISQEDAVKSLGERHKQRGDLIKTRIDEKKKRAELDRTKTAESLISTHQKRGQVYNKTTGKPITAADYSDIRVNPENYLAGTPPFAPSQEGFGFKQQNDAMKMAQRAETDAKAQLSSLIRIRDPITDELKYENEALGKKYMGDVAVATLVKDLTAQSGDYARSFSAVTNNVDARITYNPNKSGDPFYVDSDGKDVANLANPDMLMAVKEIIVKGGSVFNLIRAIRSKQGLP